MLGVENWFKLEMYYKGVWTTTACKNEIANREDVLNTINVNLPKDIPLKYNSKNWTKKLISFGINVLTDQKLNTNSNWFLVISICVGSNKIDRDPVLLLPMFKKITIH